MRRVLLVAVLAALFVAPVARAWTWPVGGPVLQPFSFDAAHPYAAGEHRGLDIGAAAGEVVLAPASGTVTFSGTVPSSGRALTITTADGLAVTLTHLGSIDVAAGVVVAEGQRVGSVGPSGDPEVAGPYVHLGIRVASEPQGYRDPASFLPARGAAPAAPPAAPVEPAPAPVPVAAPATPSVPPSTPAAAPSAVPGAPAAGPSPAAAAPDPAVAGAVVADPQPPSAARGLTVRGAASRRAPSAPVHESRVVRPRPRVAEIRGAAAPDAGATVPAVPLRLKTTAQSSVRSRSHAPSRRGCRSTRCSSGRSPQ